MTGRELSPTKVRVRDLRLLADVGIEPNEIGHRQLLVISVELSLDVGPVASLQETIDYRRIAEAAEALAEVHIPLIEIFAYRLGQQCVRWPPVTEARVSVDKPEALTRGLAGVEVAVRAF